MGASGRDAWPPLPYDEWKDTYATLHIWMQMIGKVAHAQAAPINHSWSIAFHVTPHGFSTALLPHGVRAFAIEFDFIEHRLIVTMSDGHARSLTLANQPVADFYRAIMALLREMGLSVRI